MEKELKFEMNLTAGDLWKFSMHHANSGMKGMVNLIFTVTALFLLAARWTTLSMGQRLLSVIYQNEGGANKDLKKFANEIQQLCDKWDRE